MRLSERCSTLIGCRCSSAVLWVSLTYCSSAPAAAVAAANPVRPRPSSSLTWYCRLMTSPALDGSNCHGSRGATFLQEMPGSCSSPLPSQVNNSAGCRRASSSRSELRSSVWLRVKRPSARFRTAIPCSSPRTWMQASRLSVFSSSSDSSVTVPGVTTRVTFLSTGPFARAGSPICSHSATDSPCRISFAR